MKDSGESGIDCGGSTPCDRCGLGMACAADRDCATGSVCGAAGACVNASAAGFQYYTSFNVSLAGIPPTYVTAATINGVTTTVADQLGIPSGWCTHTHTGRLSGCAFPCCMYL